MLKYYLILYLFFCCFDYVEACLPNEIHIREQWVDTYSKNDGTNVSAHERSEHCREIKTSNYFSDKTNKAFKNLKTKFKPWKKAEKDLVAKEMEGVPLWLKKYKINEMLRGSIFAGNPKNPAAAIPYYKSFIIFDPFFKMPNKKEILIHELSHLAVYDIDPILLKTFFEASGWKYNQGDDPIPPERVLTSDSKDSPLEDFANHVEIYYSNLSSLKEFNERSFEILDKIIKSKEREP